MYSHFSKKQMNNEFFMNLNRIINRKSADRADTNCPFAFVIFAFLMILGFLNGAIITHITKNIFPCT